MKKVFAMWYGGHSYSLPEIDDVEEFENVDEAREVFKARIDGRDPKTGDRTPVVEGSVMWIFDHDPRESGVYEPVKVLEQDQPEPVLD